MKSFGNHLALALSGVLSLAGANATEAQVSDNVVRVGVLNDISGIFQDTNGARTITARTISATPSPRTRLDETSSGQRMSWIRLSIGSVSLA